MKYYGNELTYEEMRKNWDTDFGGLESKAKAMKVLVTGGLDILISHMF